MRALVTAEEDEGPTIGGLEDALHLLNIFEAYCKADGQVIKIVE